MKDDRKPTPGAAWRRASPRFSRHCFLALCALALVLLTRLAWGSPVLVLTDHFERENLDEYLEYLEDPHQSFTFDKLLQPPLRDAFTAPANGHFSPGYSRSAWWLRINIQNPGGERQLALSVNQASIDHVTVYAPGSQGGYVAREAGELSEQVSGDLPLAGYWFLLDVPAGASEVLYIRLQTSLWLDPGLWIGTPAAMAAADNADTICFGIGIGILAGLAIYNLLLLRQVRRDMTGPIGGLFLLCTIGYMLGERGVLGVEFLRVPGLQNAICIQGVFFMCLSGILFAIALLRVQGRLLRLLRSIMAVVAACMAVALAGSTRLGDQLAALMAILSALAVLAAAARSYRDGAEGSGHFLLATVIVAAVAVTAGFAVTGLVPLPLPVNELIAISFIACALIVAAGTTRQSRVRHEASLRDHERLAVSVAESQLRENFLAQISHEVRTPMSGILGMTELLLDTPLTPGQKEYANTIQASCHSLLRILNDIMDFSRMESGKLSVVEEAFDLNELLHDCLDLFKAQAEEKHLELVANVSVQVNPLLIGDPTRLRQVISNLLRNAIKFTQQGEIVINILPAPTPAAAAADNGAHHIRVEITDTGMGIPSQLLPTLFADQKAGNTPPYGSGVGLAICKQLVELMGGTIGVTSSEREGSTFWFELPLRQQQAEAARDLAAEARLKGLRLLVVDDNHTVNRVIQQQASGWGMQVTTVDNGAEGLAQARNAANLGEPFDIIIVDHNMPGMSGLQLAARIKEDSLIRSEVLVIMLTGINIAPTSTMARNVGIRRVLTKPVTERQLKTAIVEELDHMERVRQEAGGGAVDDAGSLKQLRVLIAEDNHLSQKVIRGMLAKLGVSATVVANGKEVVEEVSRNDYDMVLMDCDMPFMDGYIATQSIREWERTTGRRHLPILALTAHTLDEHKDKSRMAGMDEHLSKPIEMVELQDALLRWSRRKAS